MLLHLFFFSFSAKNGKSGDFGSVYTSFKFSTNFRHMDTV